jgi:O-antigen ligase
MNRTAAVGLWFAAMVVPWLNPAAGGPSAVVQPWLISAAATLLMWAAVAPEARHVHVLIAAAVAACVLAAGHASPTVLLTVGGLLVIALSASVAASSTGTATAAKVIAGAWLAAALVSSVFALVQYFGLSNHLAPWVNPTPAGEAFANLRQRNQFATLSSIGLIALLWHLRSGTRLWWAAAAAVLLATANAASASRTGALQILLVAVLSVWRPQFFDRRNAVVGGTALLAYVAAAFVLPLLLEALLGMRVPSAFGRLPTADGCGSRAVLWSNVLQLVAQRPWAGWGWGELDYAHFATLYPGDRFCDILDNAHSLPLHLAVELGIPAALLAVCGFVYWVIRQQPWRERDATRVMAWSVIGVILLHSLLEYPLWYGPFQMAFGLSVGLLCARAPRPAGGAIRALERNALVAVLACALLYTGWDYHRVSQLYTSPEDRSAWYRYRLPRIGDSWLFRDQLAFAELSITPLTRENAPTVHDLALELLHYSPEPQVIEAAIESAMQVGREDEALWLLARYRAAFPNDYEAWSKTNRLRKGSSAPVRN